MPPRPPAISGPISLKALLPTLLAAAWGCSSASSTREGSVGTRGGAGGSGAGGAGVQDAGVDATGTAGTGGVTGMGGLPGTGGRAPGTGGAASTGGSSGSGGATPFKASYFIGADISRVETDAAGTLYTDNDGSQKEFLALLKGHGFNYIRVRTFVDPRAADGNSPTTGFYDIPHTVAFGKRIKDAGMGFLLDFHYSDNWADPGKQCVPVAWQGATTIDALATLLRDYTADAIRQLIAGGARPDMVQIGNEITPGMLIHRCDAGGIPIANMNNPVTGALSNWNNLGTLLKAGGQAIRAIDPAIQIVIHLDRGGDLNSSRAFIQNAIVQQVPFDVFGESTYALYQGPPSGWMNTFAQLAAAFPTLKFIAAEYGPEERAINDILFNLKNSGGQNVGLGTFYWEATHSGADNAGHLLFSNRVAQPDLLLYDSMKTDYAGRL
jgi:arabinogalactan endo-1,4-beta-galactosidase